MLPNLFGKNDLNFNRIVPWLIKSAIFKKNVVLNNYSRKLQFIYIDEVLKIITSNSNYIKKKNLISISQIKNKIYSLLKLKTGLDKKKFNNSFEFDLYRTIDWYIRYFKKKI